MAARLDTASPLAIQTHAGLVAYSRYAPHCSVFDGLAGAPLRFHADPATAVREADAVRDLRAEGVPFVLWEWAPPEVLEAWGEPDLVLSNGFFPHYSTVSWDRRGWVGSAEWPKQALESLAAEDEERMLCWIEGYQEWAYEGGNSGRLYLPPHEPYLLVVLQNEDDLVARWWPQGQGSEWLVQEAAEYGESKGLEVLVKQHPYDPKEAEDYEVDRGGVSFMRKDAIPYADLAKANDSLLAGAVEVWGFNSSLLTEAALVHGTPTRAFGPTLLDGHGILLGEVPGLGVAEQAAVMSSEQRRLALLKRVLGRQVSRERVAEVRGQILADEELDGGWDWVS